MSEEFDYFKKKFNNLNQNHVILGGCILLVILIVMGYFFVNRPVIVMDNDSAGIYVKNKGGIDAIIYKVEGFWYWAGQIAFLANIPSIHQRVRPRAASVRLRIPDIPIHSEQATNKSTCYMKIIVRYRIPGIPIFRYNTLLYFKYDPNRKIWAATETIPPKHRSLGNIAMGNIDKIELNFH